MNYGWVRLPSGRGPTLPGRPAADCLAFRFLVLQALQKDGDLRESFLPVWQHRALTDAFALWACATACQTGDEARDVAVPQRRVRRVPPADYAREHEPVHQGADEVSVPTQIPLWGRDRKTDWGLLLRVPV